MLCPTMRQVSYGVQIRKYHVEEFKKLYPVTITTVNYNHCIQIIKLCSSKDVGRLGSFPISEMPGGC